MGAVNEPTSHSLAGSPATGAHQHNGDRNRSADIGLPNMTGRTNTTPLDTPDGSPGSVNNARSTTEDLDRTTLGEQYSWSIKRALGHFGLVCIRNVNMQT